jgi:hypothetical protein
VRPAVSRCGGNFREVSNGRPEGHENDAARHGMTQMILETGARNHAALSLYAACGYARVPSYVTGRDPDVNRAMRKPLSPGR